jgi:hypothetical protein
MDLLEYKNRIPFFLSSFLNTTEGKIPRQGQWILTFESIPIPAIKKAIKYEPTGWDIENALQFSVKEDFVKSQGCLFAQAVEIPGEATSSNPEGLQTNGFIRSTVGAGREAFQSIKIMFLDTNANFVDNVIRPWVIATSHLGLIARSGDDNYRTNLIVYRLGTGTNGPFLLQKYSFYGICPIGVSGVEYNYTQSNSPITRDATFLYHYYTVESPSLPPSVSG